MYAQNEQVHVAAWPSFSLYDPFAHALGAEVNNAASKIYAVEGSCFVIAPCATVSQAMIDELCDTPEKHQFLHVGGGFAVIYGPDGAPLAPPLPPDQEGLLYANIDLGMISVAKAAADPAGHYGWSESHPTHVRIFGAAMKYLSSLGPAAKLRLYHEVTVARASDQFFEYLRCHERTGMLNAVLEHATAGA